MRSLLTFIACCACAGAYGQEAAAQVSEAAAKALLGWMSAQGVAGVVQPRTMSRLVDAPLLPAAFAVRPIQADQV
ncbi:MAG: hypothetical protein JWP41_1325, partial [Ramlibacter sp.]|nr:hypothetical protein [Ramlibacter sp.]